MEAEHTGSPAGASRPFAICEDADGVGCFSGDLNAMELPALREYLESRRESSRDTALSLEKLDSIHIGAIQMLISFKRSLPPHILFRFVSLSPGVERILEITGLGRALIG